MGVLEGLADLRDDLQRLFGFELPRPQEVPQVHPVHELHHQEVQFAALAEVVDADDAGVVEPGQGAALALQFEMAMIMPSFTPNFHSFTMFYAAVIGIVTAQVVVNTIVWLAMRGWKASEN